MDPLSCIGAAADNKGRYHTSAMVSSNTGLMCHPCKPVHTFTNPPLIHSVTSIAVGALPGHAHRQLDV